MESIYLDYQATTPVDKRVLEKMLPFFSERFANPHSTHSLGAEVAKDVSEAREKIARSIGAKDASKEIIFTSGATEANNLAILGLARYMKRTNPSKNHIITQKTEHKCVLSCCQQLEKEGFSVTYFDVDSTGRISLESLKEASREETFLVSIMVANNEIGILQPIKEVGLWCREQGIFFHTDAAQALGKVPFNVQDVDADLASFSGHKIYGPKGVGALYIRRRDVAPKKGRPRLDPLFAGGGQERGFRSGTLPAALCVGFGEAARLAALECSEESSRLEEFRNILWESLSKSLDYIFLNGSLENRLPHNLSIRFSFVEGEALMLALPHLALSSGSACTSQSLEGSYVIEALGLEDDAPHSSLRISLGRFTTLEEIKKVATDIPIAVKRLREMSPLYEMVKKGLNLSDIKWSHH